MLIIYGKKEEKKYILIGTNYEKEKRKQIHLLRNKKNLFDHEENKNPHYDTKPLKMRQQDILKKKLSMKKFFEISIVQKDNFMKL